MCVCVPAHIHMIFLVSSMIVFSYLKTTYANVWNKCISVLKAVIGYELVTYPIMKSCKQFIIKFYCL